MTVTTTTLEPVDDVDVHLLEHLDRDWAVPCEVVKIDLTRCGAKASWWVICRSCGHAIAECYPCRANEALMFNCSRLFTVAWCTTCNATVALDRWADLFIVEPIGVRP